mgnify:CR=1 FL=1
MRKRALLSLFSFFGFLITILSLFLFTFVLKAEVKADLDDHVRRIASKLRCPVCQNLSVADSPSELAVEMQALIKEKLQKGESEEAIIAYFVSKYGEWVLLTPKAQGFNLLIWALPFSVILVSLGGALVVLRRWVKPREITKRELWVFDPVYEERLRQELEKE